MIRFLNNGVAKHWLDGWAWKKAINPWEFADWVGFGKDRTEGLK